MADINKYGIENPMMFPQNTAPARVDAGLDPGVGSAFNLADQFAKYNEPELDELSKMIVEQNQNLDQTGADIKRAYEEYNAKPTKKGFSNFISKIEPILALGAFIADKTSGKEDVRRNSVPKLMAYYQNKRNLADRAKAEKKDTLNDQLSQISTLGQLDATKLSNKRAGVTARLNAKQKNLESGVDTAGDNMKAESDANRLAADLYKFEMGEQNKFLLEQLKNEAKTETDEEFAMRIYGDAEKALRTQYKDLLASGEMTEEKFQAILHESVGSKIELYRMMRNGGEGYNKDPFRQKWEDPNAIDRSQYHQFGTGGKNYNTPADDSNLPSPVMEYLNNMFGPTVRGTKRSFENLYDALK